MLLLLLLLMWLVMVMGLVVVVVVVVVVVGGGGTGGWVAGGGGGAGKGGGCTYLADINKVLSHVSAKREFFRHELVPLRTALFHGPPLSSCQSIYPSRY